MGSGNSCNHGLLACRPSSIPVLGYKVISIPSAAALDRFEIAESRDTLDGAISFSLEPAATFGITGEGTSPSCETKTPSCKALFHSLPAKLSLFQVSLIYS